MAPPPPPESNLLELGKRLLDSPPKTEPTPRRVRIVFNNVVVVDTTSAVMVWEHPWYPNYYVPVKDVKEELAVVEEVKDKKNRVVAVRKLVVGEKTTERVLSFERSGNLDGLVKFEFQAMDHWFEEEVPVLVHPKDPFKRIVTIPSTRSLKIFHPGNGKLLASTKFAIQLYETSLTARYYIPLPSVDLSVLRASDTTSLCPYKGRAEYYDVVVEGAETIKDGVWYYNYPSAEVQAVTGFVCFYNEKFRLEFDG